MRLPRQQDPTISARQTQKQHRLSVVVSGKNAASTAKICRIQLPTDAASAKDFEHDFDFAICSWCMQQTVSAPCQPWLNGEVKQRPIVVGSTPTWGGSADRSSPRSGRNHAQQC
jgi:hypothetical protein